MNYHLKAIFETKIASDNALLMITGVLVLHRKAKKFNPVLEFVERTKNVRNSV